MKFKQFGIYGIYFSIQFLNISTSVFIKAENINREQSLKNQNSELENDKKDLGYCCFQGTIADSCCKYESVESMNKNLSVILNDLVQTTYFRYYKVDLWRECPFWPDAGLLCTSERCSVPSVDKNKIPEEWNFETLGKVNKLSVFNDLSMFHSCDYSSKDFCIFDEESEGLRYVDLPTNPERFTGYQGEPANRVWASIYSENCFGVPSHNKEAESCTEKRVFFKLISGLHTSINTHVCYDWLDTKTGVWSPNLDCFIWKVGKFPDRIENLYLNYAIYIRAISKISDYLANYHFCNGSKEEDLRVTKLVRKVTDITNQYPPTFDESKFFSSPETKDLINDIRFQFRNVSRIMDCVSCEKCRLWGKIQITGLGTALKVLFSMNGDLQNISLKRTEIVSLINAFAKLSQSINIIEEFRTKWKKRDEEEIALKKKYFESVTDEISKKLKLNEIITKLKLNGVVAKLSEVAIKLKLYNVILKLDELVYNLKQFELSNRLFEFKDKAVIYSSAKLDVVLTKIQDILKDQNLMDDTETEDRNRIILLMFGALITILIGVLMVVRLFYNIIYNKFIHTHHHRHNFQSYHHYHKYADHNKNVKTFKKEN